MQAVRVKHALCHRRKAPRLVDEIHEVGSPFCHDERARGIDRVAMIFRRLQMPGGRFSSIAVCKSFTSGYSRRRSGRHDCALPYENSIENDRPCPDPRAVVDHDAPSRDPLIDYRAGGITVHVIERNHRPGASRKDRRGTPSPHIRGDGLGATPTPSPPWRASREIPASTPAPSESGRNWPPGKLGRPVVFRCG